MDVIGMPRGWLDLPALRAGREPFDRMSAFAYLWDRAFQCAGPFSLEGYTVRLERGQFAASIRFLAGAWGWHPCKVQRFLNRLKSDTLIDTATDTGLTVITLCNYCEIQDRRRVTDTPTDTVADTPPIHPRYKTEESKTHNNVPETRDSPEGVQGEGKNGHRPPRDWSPKINHPNQLDLISNTALAADYQAPANPEPAGDLVEAPEAELPRGLSLEGEVLPPATPEPEVAPPPVGELVLLPPPAKPSNVVRLKPETDPDFREWYATYPRHKKPLDAAKAYAEARRQASASALLEGAHRCREESAGKDKRFVAYPASWLRAGGWMEEAEPAYHAFEENRHGQHHQREERGPNALPNAFANVFARLSRNAGTSGV